MDAAALLVVTPPEGRTPIVITSLNTVDSATGQRSASAGSAPLNTEGAGEGSYVGGHYLRIHGTRLRFPFCGRGDSACILSFRYGFDAHGYSRPLSVHTEDLRHLSHCARAEAE